MALRMKRFRHRRWGIARLLLLGLIGVMAGLASLPARAEPLRIERTLCHAVTGLRQPDESFSSLAFACDGRPAGYQQGSLWLRVRLDRMSVDRDDLALMVHQSRFERLAVAFSYADGTTVWQDVGSGRFGAHWRAGGQIAFEAPSRTAPLVALTLRFDRLASIDIVRMRLIGRGDASVQSVALAAAIGAALTLLLIGALFNLSLAAAIRRQYLAWQGAWAACMLVWGAIWSQMHLLVLPGMAGTVSAQTCTFLACLAIGLATTGVVTAFGPRFLPRALRVLTLGLGGLIAAAGVPMALIRSAALDPLAHLLGILVLAVLLAVTICVGWAWRRGNPEARDFAVSWSLPMATLAFIHVVDVESIFWGGGSKVPVLFAATWQTFWLSMAAARRLANLRIERDRARAAEAQAHELARRDPLTGLRNRRGFAEAVAHLLERARLNGGQAALLLIDIDRFKSINDIYGHEAGDAVLCGIARRLERWEGAMCEAGRLGGEEFALMVIGLDGFALARFAESVRLGIAACDHGAVIGDRSVTASIGIAETRVASDFQKLYALADKALYEAKHEGRNRVSLRQLAAKSA